MRLRSWLGGRGWGDVSVGRYIVLWRSFAGRRKCRLHALAL